MTTPSLRSAAYQRLLLSRAQEQRLRWGASYPLSGRITRRTRG
jgi:hypothetical protein